MAYLLGIDLGTTYTAAATTRGGHTEIAALADRSSMVPSVLFLKELEPSGPLAPGEYTIRLTGPAMEGGSPAMVETTAIVE